MNRYDRKFMEYLLLISAFFALSFSSQGYAAVELQQSQRSGAKLQAGFQYMLSNFQGPVRSQWARLAFDPVENELYTLNPALNDVRIFNDNGMEIFAMDDTGDIIASSDIASGDNGTIYLLGRNFSRDGIQALNYRGEREAVVTIQGLPDQFSGFSPDRMEYQNGLFFLLDRFALRVVIIASDGTFKKGYDFTDELGKLLEEQEKEKEKKDAVNLEISGFSVGSDGSLYFTVPTLFSAFRFNPDESFDVFGTSGSGPGKFGIVSGIAADKRGNMYVADRLRSVVMIFESNFNFLGEFGYRGDRPQDMLVPDDVILDEERALVFVSQAANKGVGVYKVILSTSR